MTSRAERRRRKKDQRNLTRTSGTTTRQTTRDKHIAAIQQDADRYRALIPASLRRIYQDIPELETLIARCAWLVSVTDPTPGRTTEPISRNTTGTDRVLDATNRERRLRRFTQFVNNELRDLNRALADKIEPTDHDRYREETPRCWYRDCRDKDGKPTRGRRQPIDATHCQWCGRPFAR